MSIYSGDKLKDGIRNVIHDIGAGSPLPDEWGRSKLVPIYNKKIVEMTLKTIEGFES